MKRSKRLSPLSTVERAIDNKLKKVIENRKHEKITNERGQFYLLTKPSLWRASELIFSTKHMRGEGT